MYKDAILDKNKLKDIESFSLFGTLPMQPEFVEIKGSKLALDI